MSNLDACMAHSMWYKFMSHLQDNGRPLSRDPVVDMHEWYPLWIAFLAGAEAYRACSACHDNKREKFSFPV